MTVKQKPHDVNGKLWSWTFDSHKVVQHHV